MIHISQFINFLKKINSLDSDYIIQRGFSKLPSSPDNDIDMVINYEDFNVINNVLKGSFSVKYSYDYGFAEYSQMINTSYYTSGEEDKTISHGRFYIDVDSCFFYPSPYNDFKTKWTVPLLFNEIVFNTKKKINLEDTYYYIPSPECEAVLLVLRVDLEKNGIWSEKYIKRINDLVINKDIFLNTGKLVLPNIEKISDEIKNLTFNTKSHTLCL